MNNPNNNSKNNSPTPSGNFEYRGGVQTPALRNPTPPPPPPKPPKDKK